MQKRSVSSRFGLCSLAQSLVPGAVWQRSAELSMAGALTEHRDTAAGPELEQVTVLGGPGMTGCQA